MFAAVRTLRSRASPLSLDAIRPRIGVIAERRELANVGYPPTEGIALAYPGAKETDAVGIGHPLPRCPFPAYERRIR